MAAGVATLKIEQGAKYKRTMRAFKADGSAADWSWVVSARGQIRTATNAATAVADFTFDLSRKALGEVDFSLTATETAAIPAVGPSYDKTTPYVFDIEFVPTDPEDAQRMLNGTALVSPEATK